MSELQSCLGPDRVDDGFQIQHLHGLMGITMCLTLNPRNRGNLPCLNQHPWVKMGQEGPLPPLCEEDKEVTVQMPLSLMYQSQKSESLCANRPRVGPHTLTVKPLL